MIIDNLFEVVYGNSLELNGLKQSNSGINFIARTEKNNGVTATVERLKDKEPFEAGLITVAAGGSVLSSFVQNKPFYTAYHVFCLKPRKPMTLSEKLFYCMCIKANQYRYSFGRQANKTLKFIKVPDKIPEWVKKQKIQELADIQKPVIEKKISLANREWKEFQYDFLFQIKKGKRITNSQMKKGDTPCIRPIDKNNGIFKYIKIEPNHSKNTITVNYNGSIAEAFYQPKPYFALDDVNVLYAKNFEMNAYIAMFLCTLIRLEKYRYSYGRKWHKERMEKSLIKLPVDDKGKPDWQFMEEYIKSLSYSGNLVN